MGVGVGVGRFVTNDCWKRGGVFYLFFKEGSVGVGVGRFVTNDCWKRGGVFYLFCKTAVFHVFFVFLGVFFIF